MPIVDEHAASLGEKVPALQDQKSTVTFVNELLQRSKRATQDMRSEWGPNYRFFHGSQWSVARPTYRSSEVINITWSSIMQEIGIQTDSRPKTDFVATEPSDIRFAEILSKINELNWEKYSWLQRLTDLLVDVKGYVHVTHAEVTWDPELESGVGDIAVKPLDPFMCYCDPKACNMQECRWFIVLEPTPTKELQKQYPNLEIKPDFLQYGPTSGHDYRISVDTDRVRLGYGNMNFRARSSLGVDLYGGEPMTLKIRTWVKDDEITEESFTDDQTGETQYVQKKKYPGGRYIETASNEVLEDCANGVKIKGMHVPFKHGRFPLVRMVNYSYPREYAGENEITHLRGPQKITNYVWSFILDVMKRNTSPQKIVAFNAGIDDIDKITDEPGIVIEARDVNAIKMEYGPGVQASLFNVLDQAMSIQDKIHGLQEASRGAAQPGVTSGLMLEGFVEASQTRARLKNRCLEMFLQDLGQLQLGLYLQFYTQPRVFRMMNEDGFPEFVEFFVEELGQTAKLTRMDQNGTVMEASTIAVRGTPDVKVVSGSALPYARAQKTATALDLFGKGAIDQEELLKAIDWPNADEVIQRMQEAQMPPGGEYAVPK